MYVPKCPRPQESALQETAGSCMFGAQLGVDKAAGFLSLGPCAAYHADAWLRSPCSYISQIAAGAFGDSFLT